MRSGADVAVGQVIAFPMRNGTWGACRVIESLGMERFGRRTLPAYGIELLEIMTPEVPTLETAGRAPRLLLRPMPDPTSKGPVDDTPTRPAVLRVLGRPPAAYRLLGTIPGFEARKTLQADGFPWGPEANTAMLGQLYFKDREAYEREDTAIHAELRAALRAHDRKRGRRNAAKGRSGGGFLGEFRDPLSAPVVDDFEAALAKANAAIEGAKSGSKRAEVLAAIQACVEKCNDLAERHEGVIDTELAEVLLSTLSAMGAKAGVRVTVEMLDRWRNF